MQNVKPENGAILLPYLQSLLGSSISMRGMSNILWKFIWFHAEEQKKRKKVFRFSYVFLANIRVIKMWCAGTPSGFQCKAFKFFSNVQLKCTFLLHFFSAKTKNDTLKCTWHRSLEIGIFYVSNSMIWWTLNMTKDKDCSLLMAHIWDMRQHNNLKYLRMKFNQW